MLDPWASRSTGRGMTTEQAFVNDVYLSLGSNIEPEFHLPQAVAELKQFGQIKAVSSVWQSSAIGTSGQPDFLNAALLLETSLSAMELRQKAIAQIENSLGRVRTEDKNAPRTIDIDIVLFNHDILDFGRRRIPDSELLNHAYVAIPMAEVAPDYHHPEVNITLKEIASRFDLKKETFFRRDDVELLEMS